MPMVATGQAGSTVHPLLHDDPFTFGIYDECVQIKLKTVRNCIIVDLGSESAGLDQRFAVHCNAFGVTSKFVGCLPGISAPGAANVDSQSIPMTAPKA